MITPSVTANCEYSSYRPSEGMNLNLKEEKSAGNLNNYFCQGTTSDVLRTKALNGFGNGNHRFTSSTGPTDLIDQKITASQAKRASSATRNPFMLIPPSGAISAREQKGLHDQIRQLRKDKAIWVQKYELVEGELAETRDRLEKQKRYYLKLVGSMSLIEDEQSQNGKSSLYSSTITTPI